ncbi:MAG: hypothetical protein ABSB01_25530 [Streptosporangiaceae bacterium]
MTDTPTTSKVLRLPWQTVPSSPRITGDYWRIWFYVLEAAGLDVQLVNARDVKNAPGRPKTSSMRSGWRS